MAADGKPGPEHGGAGAIHGVWGVDIFCGYKANGSFSLWPVKEAGDDNALGLGHVVKGLPVWVPMGAPVAVAMPPTVTALKQPDVNETVYPAPFKGSSSTLKRGADAGYDARAPISPFKDSAGSPNKAALQRAKAAAERVKDSANKVRRIGGEGSDFVSPVGPLCSSTPDAVERRPSSESLAPRTPNRGAKPPTPPDSQERRNAPTPDSHERRNRLQKDLSSFQSLVLGPNDEGARAASAASSSADGMSEAEERQRDRRRKFDSWREHQQRLSPKPKQ